MCGIFFSNCPIYYNLFMTISHRGPDSSSVYIKNNFFYGFHRLGIINPNSNYNQPFIQNNIVLLCNGEIYNYKQLLKEYFSEDINLNSDCEIIIYLYIYFNRNFEKVVQLLDGEFAIILHDLNKNIIYCARDFMGIRPLYYNSTNNELFIASEIKALPRNNHSKHIIPRYIYTFSDNTISFTKYWKFPFYIPQNVSSDIIDIIYKYLYTSVQLRVNSERPIGCLLSGGLDSSIIVSLVSKIYPNIQCFTIGKENSPDVKAAKVVTKFLNIPHHIIPFHYEEGFNIIPNVIHALETYDTTTIRASVPQYLLAKYISEKTNIKVILSGEGSDEIFSGYLYSKLAPNKDELYKDGVRLLDELYLFDCLRTDRTMSKWGLEVRVPFLNKSLVEYILNLDPNLRLCKDKPEKQLLREVALRYNLLPEFIIRRRKEAFSDAVSSDTKQNSWINYIQLQLSEKTEKEYYHSIFKELYEPNDLVFSHYWMPQWINVNDPSATFLNLY